MRDAFDRVIRESIAEAQRIGCISDAFVTMIAQEHPVEVAKKLVLSGASQEGFKRAMEIHRKDITVEYTMLIPKFKVLFTEKELEAARWRLDNWDRF